MFILAGVHHISRMWKDVNVSFSYNVGIKNTIYLNVPSTSLSLSSSSGIISMCMLVCLLVSHRFLRLFSLVFFFFSIPFSFSISDRIVPFKLLILLIYLSLLTTSLYSKCIDSFLNISFQLQLLSTPEF